MNLLSAYLFAGLVFAVAFILFGYRAILPEAAGSGILVRLIWIGGAVSLWPYLLLCWIRAGAGR